MRTKQLLRTAAVLLVALFFWRLIGVETDLVTLRAGVARTHAAPQVSIAARRGNIPSAPLEAPQESLPSALDTTSANPTGYERTLEELQQAKARISDLESTVNELSDAWNQFATEVETKREMERRLEAVKQVESAARVKDATRVWMEQVEQLDRVFSKGRK